MQDRLLLITTCSFEDHQVDPFTILIGLTSTILGGAAVTIFEIWLKRRRGKKVRGQTGRIPANLPNPDYSKFIGRKDALHDLMRVLRPDHRLGVMSIDGIGGIGKTTLALEAAHRCQSLRLFDAFVWASAKENTLTVDGIVKTGGYFRSLSDLFGIISRVLGNFDIPKMTSSSEKWLAIRSLLSGLRVLLVIDNLETVEDEEIEAFLRELPVPSKAIVTSRHRVDAAYTLRLKGMSLDESLVLMEQECDAKAIQLNSEDRRKIHQRTGGIPLAMVWSVAQLAVKGRTLTAVLEGLSDDHEDISRYCFERSASLLAKNSLRVLYALSLTDGNISKEVASAISGLGVSATDEALAELISISFVQPRGQVFDILPLTRSYARHELETKPIVEQDIKSRWIRYSLPRESAREIVSVYFPVHTVGDLQNRIRHLVDRYNKDELGAYVLPVFTGDYGRTVYTLREAVTLESAPDVAVLEISQWLEWVAAEKIQCLEDVFITGGKGVLVDQGFDVSALLNTTYRGKLYGIPFTRSVPVLYYNRDTLEEAGLDTSSAPCTWDELITCANRVAKQAQQEGFIPVALPIEDWFFSCFTRQAGGRLIDEDGLEPSFQCPEAEVALAFWTKLVANGLASAEESWFQAPYEFLAGRRALMFHSSGTFGFLSKNADFAVGAWELPGQRRAAVEIGGANFVLLAKRSGEQNPAGWRFVEWFTQTEQTIELAVATGYLPVRKEAWHSPRIKNIDRSLAGMNRAFAQRRIALPRGSGPSFSKMLPVLAEGIKGVLKNDKPARDMLESLQHTVARSGHVKRRKMI